MSQEIETEITVTRYTSNREPYDGISLRIRDEASGIEFFSATLTLEQFGRLIAGGQRGSLKAAVCGLQNVGKKHERERGSIFIPSKEYNEVVKGPYDQSKEKLGAWLKQNAAREGWHVGTYLGSQGSIEFAEGGRQLNFHYYRYVDKIEQSA